MRDGLHFKSFCLPLDLNHPDELGANEGTCSRFVLSEAARTPGQPGQLGHGHLVTLLKLGEAPPPHRRQGPTDPVMLFILFPNSSIYFSCNLFGICG